MGKNCNVTWLLFDSGVSLEQNGQIFHSLGERVGGGVEGLCGGETPLALRPLRPLCVHTYTENERKTVPAPKPSRLLFLRHHRQNIFK